MQWEGYDERTWEPAACLSDAVALDEWLESQKKKSMPAAVAMSGDHAAAMVAVVSSTFT